MRLNQERLAIVVADLLDLPRKGRRGKAYKIVQAVVKALTVALQNGEEIEVAGFGMFKFRERPPTMKSLYYSPGRGKGCHRELTLLPAKRYVYFYPSRPLQRMLCQK